MSTRQRPRAPSLKTLATRKAGLIGRYGADDLRSIAASRQLAAAHLAAAIAAARAAGLDNAEIRAVVRTGQLPDRMLVAS